jgi:hypothetical protein
MTVGHETSFGWPVDPTLAQVMATWCDAGYWAFAWDDQWRYVRVSDETLTSAVTDVWVMGEFMFGPASVKVRLDGGAGQTSADELRAWFVHAGGVLADITGGRKLRAMVIRCC